MSSVELIYVYGLHLYPQLLGPSMVQEGAKQTSFWLSVWEQYLFVALQWGGGLFCS